MLRYLFICLVFLTSSPIISLAGDTLLTSFIGINPAITIEPYYKKGECDINIIPMVYHKQFTRHAGVRFTSIVNLGIRNTQTAISHLGGQIAMPVFLSAKAKEQQPTNGFYLAPGLGVARNRMDKHTNYGFWIEPGYMLLINGKYAITFGIQAGATHFYYDDGQSKWRSHFGAKIILGRWM